MRTMHAWMTAAAVLVGAAMAAPAARAHETRRVEVVRGREVVALRGHSPHCTWIPARWEMRTERFLERPGFWREERVPAVTRTVLDLSNWRLVRVVVSPASMRRTWVPPRWGERRVPALVPGRWICLGHRDC